MYCVFAPLLFPGINVFPRLVLAQRIQYHIFRQYIYIFFRVKKWKSWIIFLKIFVLCTHFVVKVIIPDF